MAVTPSTIKLPVTLDVVWRREGHEPLVVGTITTEIEVPVKFGTPTRTGVPAGGIDFMLGRSVTPGRPY